jgi:polyhydroxyalkanoic acid synthase PhaR subunit
VSGKSEESKTFDPFGPWRALRDAGLEAWSKAMIQAVNSEEYAKTAGALLNFCLSTAAPFRRALEQAIARPLEQFNMPARADILSLAEHLTNIERRLDDLDAKLNDMLHPRPAPASKGRAGRRESFRGGVRPASRSVRTRARAGTAHDD